MHAVLTYPTDVLLLLSLVAGGLHVIAPDHWLPASIWAWKLSWTLKRTAIFSAILLGLHAVAGAAIFIVFQKAGQWFGFTEFVNRVEGPGLLIFAISITWLGMIIRLVRYPRVREVLHSGPRNPWGLVTVVSLLGPCESIIPILMKAKTVGVGYGLPLAAFVIGTWGVGISAVLYGRLRWNRPFQLPYGLRTARQVTALLPVTLGLLLGLGAILRL